MGGIPSLSRLPIGIAPGAGCWSTYTYLLQQFGGGRGCFTHSYWVWGFSMFLGRSGSSEAEVKGGGLGVFFFVFLFFFLADLGVLPPYEAIAGLLIERAQVLLNLLPLPRGMAAVCTRCSHHCIGWSLSGNGCGGLLSGPLDFGGSLASPPPSA